MVLSQDYLTAKFPEAGWTAAFASDPTMLMAMEQMGVNKLVYYAEISARLKMKKPFTTTTKLTKKDLERVYVMVLGDARGR